MRPDLLSQHDYRPKYELPEHICPLGYTHDQVKELVGEDRLKEFYDYMRGQTVALCDGKLYNHETKEYEPSCEQPHGIVTYGCDIRSFLDGRPPLD